MIQRLATEPITSSFGSAGTKPVRRISLTHLLIMLVCGYFLFFFRVGSHDLWSPDEPRYAQVAREMLRSGDWTVPHLNGEIYTEKPPLYFWLVAALSKPFGDVNETTARFPSATAALLTLLLTCFFGIKIIGRREALLGALVTATSAQFIWIGRIGVIDMLLTLCILAALAFFYSGYSKRSAPYHLVGFLCLAPAALAKGPVGVAVPVVVMLAFLVVEIILHKNGAGHEMARFLLCMLAGLALVALIVTPWWSAAFEKSGGVYGSLPILLKQTRGRMIESYSHRQPIYYYFTNILWQFLPWTVLLPLTMYSTVKNARLRDHRGLRFLATWVATILIFFTLISGKRSQYILPLFPALGLITGWALMQWNPLEGRLKESKVFYFPMLLLLIFAAAALAAFPIVSHIYLPHFFRVALPAVVILAAGLFFISRLAPARPPAFALMCIIIAATISASAVFGYVAPSIDKHKSARPFCSAVLAAVGESDSVYFYKIYRPNINYYMGRGMKRLDSEEEVFRALEEHPKVFLVLEHKRLDTLAFGDSFTIERVARDQIGSRDMICVVVARPADRGE